MIHVVRQVDYRFGLAIAADPGGLLVLQASEVLPTGRGGRVELTRAKARRLLASILRARDAIARGDWYGELIPVDARRPGGPDVHIDVMANLISLGIRSGGDRVSGLLDATGLDRLHRALSAALDEAHPPSPGGASGGEANPPRSEGGPMR